MELDVKWASTTIVIIIMLVAFLIINAQEQIKNIDKCKEVRIVNYQQKYFTWNGIVELTTTGKYQPNCL